MRFWQVQRRKIAQKLQMQYEKNIRNVQFLRNFYFHFLRFAYENTEFKTRVQKKRTELL